MGIDNIGEDFLDKYWDYELNDELKIDPWSLTVGCNKKIYIKCETVHYHKSYSVAVCHFTGNNPTRCPYCTKKSGKIHPFDSLASMNPEVISLWSSKNDESPFNYASKSNKFVYWKCENGVHEDYKRKVNKSNTHEFRCPKCSAERRESFLQEKIRLFLTEKLYFKVNHEYDCELKCINPNTNYILPYDNEVKINENVRLIIEVHGKQHYKINKFNLASSKKNGTSVEEELAYIKWKDQYKKEYAISQGYHYLEVPYWTDNNEEEWKTLINNKLNKII